MKLLLFLFLFGFTAPVSTDIPSVEIIKVYRIDEDVNVAYRLRNLNDVFAIKICGSANEDVDINEGYGTFTDKKQDLVNVNYYFTFIMNDGKRIKTESRTFQLQ
jgi:hypothetical protein